MYELAAGLSQRRIRATLAEIGLAEQVIAYGTPTSGLRVSDP